MHIFSTPQKISNVGPHFSTFFVYVILTAGVADCMNFSTTITTSMFQIGELINQFNIVDISGFQLPRDSNFNLLVTFNVSIPRAPLSVATYQSMLTTCVASGKYTAYMRSAAAQFPNSTALLQASSSSVKFGIHQYIYLGISLLV